jgi:DNA-binding transcriptional MocR family regulator
MSWRFMRRIVAALRGAADWRKCGFAISLIAWKPMPIAFADRLANVETSAIRELFKLLGKPGIISFAGGFPDSAMFDVEGIREASERVLREEPGAALQYGATEGYQPLREQLSAFMAAKGAPDVAPEGLIVTTGSQQALDLLGKTLISPGDKVIVEGPTFLATIQCFRLYGAQLISAPIDGQGVQTDRLEQLIAEHRPKFVYLIPTFGNPSGATLSLERRRKVLELAVKYQTVVVEDDPYGDLYFGEAPPPSLLALSREVPGSREWLVHCGSLSKVLSPGLRVGWMIAPAALLAKATMCKQFSDAHTSTFAQATAARYLQAGRMPATLARVRQVYAERAQAMGDALRRELGDAISFVPPQGGLFVWARLTGAGGKVADGNVLAQRAIDKGVAFVPGAPFFCAEPDHATLRLSFATADVDKIREGVARLAQAVQA